MKFFIYIVVFLTSLFSGPNKIDVLADVYSKGMLGAVVDGKMRTSMESYDLMHGYLPKAPFTVYMDNRIVEEGVHATFMRVRQQWHDRYYPFHTDAKSKKGIVLPSSIDWKPFPRKVSMLSPENATYQKAVADYLRGKGMKNPQVKIVKIWRVDADNDGRDEVFIEAGYFQARSAEAKDLKRDLNRFGDYSVILMRKIQQGEVVTTSLREGSFVVREKGVQNAKDAPFYRYELVNVIDIDGDGKMEVLIYEYDSEMLSCILYEWQKGELKWSSASMVEAAMLGGAL